MAEDKAFEDGMAVRRKMWGTEGADQRLAGASSFNRPFEELITEYCFGKVWTRELLDHKTRSLLTIAILATLGKPTQLKTHVRGAIANGATPDEIREVLMHVGIYGGVPAGADAFIHAREQLKEMGLDK